MNTVLGKWIYDIDKLNLLFINNQPYSYVVINNFFSNEIFNKLDKLFPNINTSNWKCYNNPLEYKYAYNEINTMNNEFKNIFNLLQSDEFIRIIKKITSIYNLEKDPLLHGAGLHYYPKNGKLDLHLDYSLHPLLKKERRVNLIIYINQKWEKEWGGELDICSSHLNFIKQIIPIPNSAILFKTNDISIHGVTNIIKCPENEGRKSIAIYYISDPQNNNIIIRNKAEFIEIPNEENKEQKNKLRLIRKNRLITKEDIELIWPEFKYD